MSRVYNYLKQVSAIERFGKILFGDLRDKAEKDTPYEKGVFGEVVDWATGEYMNGEINRNNINRIIDELRELKHEYPDVLMPNANVLYRAVDPRRLRDMSLYRDDFEPAGNYMITKKTVDYKPRSYIQSWTLSPNKAVDFMENIKGEMALIYI